MNNKKQKKQEEKIIKKNIMRIMDMENRYLNIRETTLKLQGIGIKKSPQVVKRLLLELINEGKLEEKSQW